MTSQVGRVGYDPLDPVVVADPYPFYAQLRAEAPVHLLEDGLWAVSRYDDVLAVLRDPTTFSSALGMGDLLKGGASPRMRRLRPDRFGIDLASLRILIATDPPDHTKLRRLAGKAFTPREVAALEPRIRQLCEAMVDELITASEDGRGDLVAQVAYPLPVTVIAELLGIPIERRDDFKRWSDALVGGLSGTWDEAQAQASAIEMFVYFTEVVAERQARPGEDLISLLCVRAREGDDALNPMEIVAFCVLLLIAGNETTTNLIGNGMRALWAHPDEARRLRAHPGLASLAVEEALRYDAPVQALFRATTVDTELAGVSLPRHAPVMVMFGSANRDGAHFERPDQFVIDRSPNDHLAFGSGIHLCLGAPLARLEGRIVAETMLERVRKIEPAGEPQFVDSFVLRGLSRLPVHCVPV